MKKSLLALIAFTSLSAFAESPLRDYKVCTESVVGNQSVSYISLAKAEGGRKTFIKIDKTISTLTMPGTTYSTGYYPIPAGENGELINTNFSLSHVNGQNEYTLVIGKRAPIKFTAQAIMHTQVVRPEGTVLPTFCGQI